jgi:hypothetical protein
VVLGCKQLRELQLSHCSVTDAGLDTVARGAGLGFERLCVSDCGISFEGVKILLRERPTLKVVHSRSENDDVNVHDIDAMWTMGEFNAEGPPSGYQAWTQGGHLN